MNSDKKYYAKNKDIIRARQKRYYENNKLKWVDYNKKWREKNNGYVSPNKSIHQKKSYYKHRDERLKMMKEYREKNKDILKIKRKENKDKILQNNKKFRKTDKGLFMQREIAKRYKRNHPEKVRAGNIVRYAVKKGKLIRPKICPKCKNSGKIEAHHEDYSKPFQITWLCRKCHLNAHNNFMRK